MATGQYIEIPPPAYRPSALSLLASVPETNLSGIIGKRWMNGVTFVPQLARPITDTTLAAADVCADVDLDALADGPPTAQTFDPFYIPTSMTCSGLSMSAAELHDRNGVSHEVARSGFVAAWLKVLLEAHDTAVGNVSGTPLLVAKLEQQFADTYGNAEGIIYMTPLVLAQARAANAIECIETPDGTITGFISPAGHVVVADAGFGSLSAGTKVFMSGPLGWHVAPFISSRRDEEFDPTRNTETAFDQEIGIVWFDQNSVVSAVLT
jgi:hypothetical protein